MDDLADLNIKGAKKLSPLELNNIKLSVKHTILTPQYLDKLVTANSQDADENKNSQTAINADSSENIDNF